MNLESRMVTEREVRIYVDSRKITAKLTGIFTFITVLLCLLIEMLSSPFGMRIPVDQGHGEIKPGVRAFSPLPASFVKRH